jgi:DNA repair protein RadA/Sms
MRLKEAAKLGFSRALAPLQGASDAAGVRQLGVSRLADATAQIEAQAWDATPRGAFAR